MSTVFHKVKSVLEAHAKVGQEVLSHEVNQWYRRAYGKSAKISLGPYSCPAEQTPGATDLLLKLGRVAGSKSYRYRVTDAIKVSFPEAQRLSQYEIIKQALKHRRGEKLTGSEIRAELERFLGAPAPEGLKNLNLFTASSKLKDCKNGNHLLSSQGHSQFYVCTPESEQLALVPSDPQLAFLKEAPDAFQQEFMLLWHDQIPVSEAADYTDWWRLSEKNQLFSKHPFSESQQAAFKHLLNDSPQVPLLEVLRLVCQASSLEQLYSLLKSLPAPAMTYKAHDLDYALESIARGLELKQRSHAPLLAYLSKDFMQDWRLYEALYYRRLHYQRRAREKVLNNFLPQVLAQKGVGDLVSNVFLEHVIEWFLGGGKHKRQQLSASENDLWYQAGYDERMDLLKTGDQGQMRACLDLIWSLRAGLEKRATFDATLKQMVDIVYAIPGFGDSPQLHYPAIYLATGLLSLLFPEQVFTVSDHSLMGLKMLLTQVEQLPTSFKSLLENGLPKDPREPSLKEIVKLLSSIRFDVVAGLNAESKADQAINPRKLDMLLYTLRGHTVKELEQMREQEKPDPIKQQQKQRELVKKIFKKSRLADPQDE